MVEFECSCKWRFIVGKQKVFGPIFSGPGEHAAYHAVGRMMSREQFEDEYADCAARYAKLVK